MTPAEVAIYIKKIQTHFEKNTNDKKYFLVDKYGDLFFQKLNELSFKNFETTGDPTLTLSQFEYIKTILIIKSQICLN